MMTKFRRPYAKNWSKMITKDVRTTRRVTASALQPFGWNALTAQMLPLITASYPPAFGRTRLTNKPNDQGERSQQLQRG